MDAYVQLLRTASHESVHVVVAVVLELRIHSAEVGPEPGSAGRVWVQSPRTYEEALRTLAFYLAPIAHEQPLPIDAGSHDLGRATELWQHWRMTLNDWLWACATAREVLDSHQQLALTFTDALVARRSLTADDIAMIVEDSTFAA